MPTFITSTPQESAEKLCMLGCWLRHYWGWEYKDTKSPIECCSLHSWKMFSLRGGAEMRSPKFSQIQRHTNPNDTCALKWFPRLVMAPLLLTKRFHSWHVQKLKNTVQSTFLTYISASFPKKSSCAHTYIKLSDYRATMQPECDHITWKSTWVHHQYKQTLAHKICLIIEGWLGCSET